MVYNPFDADVCFSSVFGSDNTPVDRTIFYIGENLRPNFSRCRFALSFDLDDWGGRNFYLPLWYARLQWPGLVLKRQGDQGLHGHEPLIPVGVLSAGRSAEGLGANERSAPRKFCAMVASAAESFRINAWLFLSAYKQVEGFGMLFGNPLNRSKASVLGDYKFCLCPENGLHPGYVTEKLFDAYAAGCVPLYYGDISGNPGINQRAFINYVESQSIERFLERVVAADNDPALYRDYFVQPLLSEPPSLDGAIHFLRGCLRTIARA